MITGNGITNIAKLNINFEEKARELQHGNNMEVDETMTRIRLMHYNNASIESMITSLDKYKQQKLETAATYAETTPGELIVTKRIIVLSSPAELIKSIQADRI